MVKPFVFSQTPKIIFGVGKIEELLGIARSYGNNVLLVTGKNSFVNSKHGEFLFHTFDIAGIRYSQVHIGWEPSPDMIDQAVIRNMNTPINVVIAVGGGSVIDAGKAISAMLYKSESVKNYIEGVGSKNHPGTKLPFIAVPTTSGTGSETTKNAVISKTGHGGFKKSLRHDNFVPDIALVDPELTLNCPPDITAASGMDCFTQLIESYLSDKASTITNALALDGLQYIKDALIRSWKWGQDIEARSGMSYAALLSGICLANANLGVVHGFASSIGGLFNIPHGTICGTLMAASNKINVEKLRKTDNQFVLNKYENLGRLFVSDADKSKDWYIDAFINKLYEFTELLKINKLGKYGMSVKDMDSIVDKTETKANPVKLDKEDLLKILEERI